MGHMLHMQLTKQLWKNLGHHQAVLQRIPCARRRLRAVTYYPPLAIGRTGQIGRVVKEMDTARWPYALHLVQKTLVAKHHRRRNRAAVQQLLRPIHIGQYAVKQIRALADALFNLAPLLW